MIQWTAQLSVGVDLIDEQHKELFERVNAVLEAVGRASSREEIADALAFLEVYVWRHFRDEEKLMEGACYPKLAIQRREHARFVALFQKLKGRFEQGDLEGVEAEAKLRLVSWLVNHVCEQDRDFAEFMKRRG